MAEPQLILVFYSCVSYIPVAYNSAAYFTALYCTSIAVYYQLFLEIFAYG